jgi:hypothetical protein
MESFSGAETAYPSGAPGFAPGFWWGPCYSIFCFICIFCRSLFVFLYFFFCPLCCLFFLDIQILIASLWYLQTLLNAWYLVFFLVVCRSLFVLSSFFFWPLCCLFYFAYDFWLPLWCLQTFRNVKCICLIAINGIRFAVSAYFCIWFVNGNFGIKQILTFAE